MFCDQDVNCIVSKVLRCLGITFYCCIPGYSFFQFFFNFFFFHTNCEKGDTFINVFFEWLHIDCIHNICTYTCILINLRNLCFLNSSLKKKLLYEVLGCTYVRLITCIIIPDHSVGLTFSFYLKNSLSIFLEIPSMLLYLIFKCYVLLLPV